MRICVFSGTTEGHELSRFLAANGVPAEVFVATEYGAAVMEPMPGITVHEGRLDENEIAARLDADTLLIDFVRNHGCLSVKRGCETANCGLCTVFMDEKPILSCSMLAARASGHSITTLEGLQDEAAEFGAFIADQGAEQCGFCNPGFIMNALALFREKEYPTEEEIKEYLAGNLCRCTGYQSQLRSLRNYLNSKKENAPMQLEAEVFGADIGKEWKNE